MYIYHIYIHTIIVVTGISKIIIQYHYCKRLYFFIVTQIHCCSLSVRLTFHILYVKFGGSHQPQQLVLMPNCTAVSIISHVVSYFGPKFIYLSPPPEPSYYVAPNEFLSFSNSSFIIFPILRGRYTMSNCGPSLKSSLGNLKSHKDTKKL